MSSNVSTNKMKNVTNTLKSSKTFILAIAVIIIIIFIYYVYQSFTTYTSTSPYLVLDTIEGNAQKVITADTIADPSDGKYGQEFTYSTWLYVKDTNFTKTGVTSINSTTNTTTDPTTGLPTNSSTTSTATLAQCDNTNQPAFKMIFNKGSSDFYQNADKSWHYPTLSCPGVFLYPDTNKIHIRFNTYDKNNIYKSADVGNIPLNKWFMLTIIVIGSSADIYINDMLKKRENVGVIKMNYGDLHIGSFGGFDGYLANFRYFNRAVQAWEIDEMYQIGVNSEMKQPVANIQQVANLSNNYFFTTGFPNSSFNGTSSM